MTGGTGSLSMKIRHVLRVLRRDGWVIVRIRGSHRQLQHPTKRGTVTVSGHPTAEVARGTLKSIVRQAGIEEI